MTKKTTGLAGTCKLRSSKSHVKIIYEESKFCFKLYAYNTRGMSNSSTFGGSNEKIELF